MKLKTITAILKSTKHLYTYTSRLVLEKTDEVSEELDEDIVEDEREEKNPDRWISNGVATYKLDERIAFTRAEHWLILLDVPDDKHKDWTYYDSILPSDICFDDTDETEIALDILEFTLGWRDKLFRFFSFDGKIIAVNEEYLKPFWGVDEEYVTFHGRTDDKGNIHIAVKTGLILQAIITPYLLEKIMDYDDIDNGQGKLICDIFNVGYGLKRQMEGWYIEFENRKENK